MGPRPLINTGSLNFFIPGGVPPNSDNPEVDELAMLWPLAPPDWWIGDTVRFEDRAWPRRILTEVLDRLRPSWSKAMMFRSKDAANLDSVRSK